MCAASLRSAEWWVAPWIGAAVSAALDDRWSWPRDVRLCEPGPAIGCLRGPRCRVVDQRGDLRELDACRGAVEALDAFGELRREECPCCLLGFPEIHVSRAPVL